MIRVKTNPIGERYLAIPSALFIELRTLMRDVYQDDRQPLAKRDIARQIVESIDDALQQQEGAE